MKYKKWLNEWLGRYVRIGVKNSTYIKYKNIVRLYLLPRFGDYELKALRGPLLQNYIAGLSENGSARTRKGLAPNTVNGIVTLLQCSLRAAVACGLLKEKKAVRLQRPRSDEKRVDSFSLEEQKKIEAYVGQKGQPKLFGILLCLYTGIRIGELLALTWADIDLENGALSVTKTCYDSFGGGKYAKVIESPKTRHSVRTVPLPKQLIPLFCHNKTHAAHERVVADKAKEISVRSYQRTFELILKKLRIPHHGFHALRHTFATRALECGMDVKTLSEILGHKDPTVTLNRYAHSFHKHKAEMMNRIGELL